MVAVLSELEGVTSEDSGRCFIRMAGVIENACEIEIVGITRRKVRLRYRTGEDPPKEIELGKRDILKLNLHVKTTHVGADS